MMNVKNFRLDPGKRVNHQELSHVDLMKKKNNIHGKLSDKKEESYSVSGKMSDVIEAVTKKNELEEILHRKKNQQMLHRIHKLIERANQAITTVEEDLKYINEHKDTWKDTVQFEEPASTLSTTYSLQKEFVAGMENLAKLCNKADEILKNSKITDSRLITETLNYCEKIK